MPGDSDRSTRTDDTIPAACREPVAETTPAGDQRRPAAPIIVESDENEEAGYGYGV